MTPGSLHAAFLALWALLLSHTSTQARRSDGHFPLPDSAVYARGAPIFLHETRKLDWNPGAFGTGSRGGDLEIGVEEGMLCTKETEKTKEGSQSGNYVQTYYKNGRVKKVERIGANGVGVTEAWDYDDSARSVTHYPIPGPLTRTTKSVLSADGATLTVNTLDGGERPYLRQTRTGSTVTRKP